MGKTHKDGSKPAIKKSMSKKNESDGQAVDSKDKGIEEDCLSIEERKIYPPLAGLVRKRVDEMWDALLSKIKQFEPDFLRRKELIEKIELLTKKIEVNKKQLETEKEIAQDLDKGFNDALDKDQGFDRIMEDIAQNKIEINKINTVIDYLQDEKILNLKEELEEVERDISKKVYGEARLLRLKYSRELDNKIQKEIEVDIIGWDLALSWLNNKTKVRFPERNSLLLAYNRNVFNAFLPPTSRHRRSAFQKPVSDAE